MFENFPKDYKWLQRIFESFVQKQSRDKRTHDKALIDMSKELSTKIDTEVAKVSKGGDADRPGVPTHIPAPQDLKVLDLLVLGIATVNPFTRWKYAGKIKGYEFYGSHTTGFNPTANTTTLTGVHSGVANSPFLYTKDKDGEDPDNTVILEGYLTGLTLENLTQDKSGTIWNWGWGKAYKLYAGGVRWNKGDSFRIKKYPANKLFSIGAWCYFHKYPLLPFYVKARTVGGGHSYSAFTSEEASFDISTPAAPTWSSPPITFSEVYWPLGSDSAKVDMTVHYEDYDPEDGVIDIEVDYWLDHDNRQP